MKPAVRGVLFDMDDTLFDHNFATHSATGALRESEPALAVWTLEELRRRHSEVLEIVHLEVISGRLSVDDARRERFRRLLTDAGAAAAALDRAADVAALYRREYQRHWRAVEGAIDLLTELKARGCKVAVVTNNITSEQVLKSRHCAIEPLVDALITSEDTKSAKPDTAIYAAALSAIDVTREEAVMVGDAWDTDIAGAIAAGVRPVWFNWRKLPARETVVAEIQSLAPLDAALKAIDGSS
jgi:putative hydrolase of the HAD superfamily